MRCPAGDITEEEHEVTCTASGRSCRRRPSRGAGPRGAVRLGAETVTENHKVNETLRQEQIDEPGVTGKSKR